MTPEQIKNSLEHNHQIIIKTLEACPNIVLVGTGDPVIRQKTQPVSLERGIEIGEELKSTLKKYREIAGYGRGLAAPQIGKNESVFVTYVDDKFKAYINPKVLERSKDFYLYREGCLSCAYTTADVKRPRSITIEYMDEGGSIVKDEVNGFLARLLQHEYDHLEGVLNIDVAEIGGLSPMFFDPLKEGLREC
jgi:peptide deformylase